ncbi:2-octaprenyl-6-methoxyphenol hydroxylase [Hyphomicrobium sulfonivorans]|uniref:2-octaprenyl-6-methoxyphenol hydroxylase n=1 Tax=Hyphomicrobium sulfonivorans TaxID=121290 RepID=A0A120CUI9_HYPSL|nr:FAD-dependent monooxygenase [Hyphomicrobium sulfonivorans]KWT66300.1 2-octaprenyl-6-methoxyphenol hydroxylase [Hyphomicrobium sulfonivorans]
MAQQPARFDVAISGASYAGMALACALADALGDELRIALIDRAAPPAATSGQQSNHAHDARAFALSAASRHLLQAIGVWDSIAHAAQPVTGIELTDSPLDAGVRPVLLRYDNVTGDGEAATHIVPAHLLADALRARVAAHPSITLLAPASATGFSASDATATVQLADGREINAALVIAADGRKSTLREAANIKLIGWDYAQTGIVTTVQHAHPHEGRAVQHFLPGGPFAILPLTGNRACITWSEDAREAARILALDDDGFLREVEKRFGGRLGAITLEGPRQSWPLSMHLARSYVAQRFALIGDAAHGVHPIAGQGLNLGLRDVAALTEAVADNMRLGFDAGDALALRRYERWRRFDSAVSTATFDGINRLFSSDATLLRSAREFGLGVVDRVPALKRFFVEEAAGLTGDVPKLLSGKRV